MEQSQQDQLILSIPGPTGLTGTLPGHARHPFAMAEIVDTHIVEGGGEGQ